MTTLRHLVFTYGCLALIAGVFIFMEVFITNSSYAKVTAEVFEIKEDTYEYYGSGSSEAEIHTTYTPQAKYTYKGEEHECSVLASGCGLSYEEIGALQVGDTVDIYIDPVSGDNRFLDSYGYAVAQLIVSAVLILLGAGGLKTYRQEFLGRYKAPVIFTAVMSAIVLAYAVYEEFIFYPTDSFMSVMQALGRFIFLFILMAVALIAEIVVWTVSVVRHRKKEY